MRFHRPGASNDQLNSGSEDEPPTRHRTPDCTVTQARSLCGTSFLEKRQDLCCLLVGDAKQRDAGLHQNLLAIEICGRHSEVRVTDGNGRIRQARLRRLQ